MGGRRARDGRRRPYFDAARAFRLLGRATRRQQLLLFCVAILVGILGGGASIAFRESFDVVRRLAHGAVGFSGTGSWSGLAWWQVLSVTTGGGLVVGLLVQHLMPGRRPQAVADVIEAAMFRDARMGLRAGLAAAMVSALSLGFGASAGREGPVVHLGATLGAVVGEKLRLGAALSRTLLGCGVAAAVAASFNAPIAGVFFALEIVIGHYGPSTFTQVVIASVVGTVVSRLYFGDLPSFLLSAHGIESFYELPGFVLLGAVSAVTAIVFMRAVPAVEKVSESLPVPPWTRPVVGGLLIGLVALVFPQVLGVGYEATDRALQQQLGLWLLAALVVAKIVATAISLGCGFGGGVFSPALFIGAMLGGAYGTLATSVFPNLSSGSGAYAIVGMGAVTGAVLGAPISTILIVFEMTGDYTLTLAVMVATTTASMLTRSITGHSYFTDQLHRRGLDVESSRDQRALRLVKVRRVCRADYVAVAPDAILMEVRAKLLSVPYGKLFVVDDDGRLQGAITISALGEAAFDTSQDAEKTAVDVARHDLPVLALGDDLLDATQLLDETADEQVPVVENHDEMRIVGVVHQRDVLRAHQQAIESLRREERSGR